MEELDKGHKNIWLAKKIGIALRYERKRAGMSQQSLSKQANVHVNYICQIERGKRLVTVDILNRLVVNIGLGMGDFFQQVDNMDEKNIMDYL